MSALSCPICAKPLPDDAPQGICPACLLQLAMQGSEAVSQPPEQELQQLAAAFPQLVIEEMIGQGGMGRVYRAQQPHLHRTVALKVLSAERVGDPEWLERFNREARALARLSHPHIVQVYDFGEQPLPYLLMEHVEGVNLRQAMQHGGLTACEALVIVPKLCDALHYAHEHGVLHRDIKPENILIDTEGRVKLVDFGLAKLRDEGALPFTLTQSGSKLGTLAYMAPEQVEKPAEVDHRADIYSLGVVLYEMLTGELPLGRFPTPSEAGGLDARLDEVVMRTLEKRKERRFQSAEQMKSGIEVAASRPLRATASTAAKQWVRYAIAAGVLGLLAMLWFAQLQSRQAKLAALNERQKMELVVAQTRQAQDHAKAMYEQSQAWITRATQADSKAAQNVVLQEALPALTATETSAIRAALIAVGRMHQLEFDRAPFRELIRQHLKSEIPEVRAEAINALVACQPEDADRARVLALVPDCTEAEMSALAYAMQAVSKHDFTGEFAAPMLNLLERGMAAAQRHAGPHFDSRSVLGAIWGAKVSPQIEARLIEWSHLGEDADGILHAGNSTLGYNTFYHALSVQTNKSRAAVTRILELARNPDTTNIAGRCLWGLNGTVPDQNDQAYVATEVIKLLELRSDDYLWKRGLALLGSYGNHDHLPALVALAAGETLPQARKVALQTIITQLRATP